MSGRHLTPAVVRDEIDRLRRDPHELLEWLREQMPYISGPTIDAFEPAAGHPGCLVTITGRNFAEARADNEVEIGGAPALVVAATQTELRVLTDPTVRDGPVKVTIAGQAAVAPFDFRVLGYPRLGTREDGPPIAFTGSGTGEAGDINPIGDVHLVVALLTPSDQAPPAAARASIDTAWGMVETFYDQASYGRTNIIPTTATNWKTLDGPTADFLSGDNIDQTQFERIFAQAAQAVVDEGHQLSDVDLIACVIYLNGTFIRGWGNISRQNFAYSNGKPVGDPGRVAINLSAGHDVGLCILNETADWGRCAHEFGHDVVSAPTFTGDGTATLKEDVYTSAMIDPSAATAALFDIMGNHDTHPLFSGYHLEKLGYYGAANIREIAWSRNPYAADFDVVAHDLVENTNPNRVHLVKIRVASGLWYYIQVRQQPGSTAQVFDDNIPLDGAPNGGGVIVTRVIADTLQINQQTRFITLAHDPHVLKAGDVVEDPARTIRISVTNDSVQARPLVCRVHVEWAQKIDDDPNGSFDLSITPWDGSYTTPDIWIDRAPFGVFDNALDSEGRPLGNGDRPMVGQTNEIVARISVSGAMGASDVQATFYAVTPPGVGDNGNWSPLGTRTIPAIQPNDHADTPPMNWTPVVGKHTCLKVFAERQLGEISVGNNSAQENVADFESVSSSPAAPVFIPTAIRNPVAEPRLVHVRVHGVPDAWRVYFPHSWVWLDGLGERELELVVIPEQSFAQYKEKRVSLTAFVHIDGAVAREYREPLPPADLPAPSRLYPIGGILDRVSVRRAAEIDVREDREQHDEWIIGIAGSISPALADQRIRVELIDPAGFVRVSEVSTNAQGAYATAIDVRTRPSIDVDSRWQPGDPPLHGTYRASAWIFRASEAATTQSKTIYIAR